MTFTAAVVIMISASVASGPPARAQETRAQDPGGPLYLAQLSAERSFDIPAQPLTTALTLFGQQSGIQVTVHGALVRDINAPEVRGRMTGRQGLDRLLAGSGLTYVVADDRTVAIEKPGGQGPGGATVLDPITVEGQAGPPRQAEIANLPPPYAGGQVARGGKLGILGNKDFMDTPFNQTSYTSDLIQNQQAKTGNDVLINDPSVYFQGSRSGGFEQYAIRGFGGLGQDRASVNGIWGAPPIVPMEMMERVEVLKGPSAFLSGMPASNNSLGGTVNFVTKRAHDEPLTQLTASYISDLNFGAHADIGRRFGDNKEFGARFNASYRNGETAVENNKQEYGLLALNLDYRGDRVRLSADLSYKKSDIDAPTRFVLLNAGVPVPSAPDASKNFLPPWTNLYHDELFGMAQGEVDILDNVTAYAAFNARDWSTGGYVTTPTINNANGDWTAFPATWGEDYIDLAGQAGIRASVDTWAVHHDLVVDGFIGTHDYSYVDVSGSAVSSNIYVEPNIPNPELPTHHPIDVAESTRSSVGVSDTLSILDERVQLTMGVRRQELDSDSFDSTGAVTNSYNDSAWTPLFALVVKPLENVSVYASYIEGLERGTVVGASYANAGEVFPPFKTKQYEAGVKGDWGTLSTTVSAFSITRPSTIAIAGTPLPTLSLDGEQINRGVEVNLFGEPVEGVRLLGGVTFLDAELTKTQDGANDGNTAPGVPDVSVAFGAEWDTPFVPGFTLAGRVNHATKAYVDAANSRSAPGWTRVDLGARYSFDAPWNGKPVVVRFDVQNVLGADYWLPSNGVMWLSSPRTFLLSSTFNF